MAKGDEFYVRFNISGHVKETIEMVDPDLTAEQLQAGLNSGKYAATIQEDGDVIEVATMTVVAKVIYVDNECEYDEFTVDEA